MSIHEGDDDEEASIDLSFLESDQSESEGGEEDESPNSAVIRFSFYGSSMDYKVDDTVVSLLENGSLRRSSLSAMKNINIHQEVEEQEDELLTEESEGDHGSGESDDESDSSDSSSGASSTSSSGSSSGSSSSSDSSSLQSFGDSKRMPERWEGNQRQKQKAPPDRGETKEADPLVRGGNGISGSANVEKDMEGKSEPGSSPLKNVNANFATSRRATVHITETPDEPHHRSRRARRKDEAHDGPPRRAISEPITWTPTARDNFERRLRAKMMEGKSSTSAATASGKECHKNRPHEETSRTKEAYNHRTKPTPFATSRKVHGTTRANVMKKNKTDEELERKMREKVSMDRPSKEKKQSTKNVANKRSELDQLEKRVRAKGSTDMMDGGPPMRKHSTTAVRQVNLDQFEKRIQAKVKGLDKDRRRKKATKDKTDNHRAVAQPPSKLASDVLESRIRAKSSMEEDDESNDSQSRRKKEPTSKFVEYQRIKWDKFEKRVRAKEPPSKKDTNRHFKRTTPPISSHEAASVLHNENLNTETEVDSSHPPPNLPQRVNSSFANRMLDDEIITHADTETEARDSSDSSVLQHSISYPPNNHANLPTLEATLVDMEVYDAVVSEPVTFNLLNPETMTDVTISMDSIYPIIGHDEDGGSRRMIDIKCLFQSRRELRDVFGWKKQHDERKQGVWKSELQADRFIENCWNTFRADGNELQRVISEFYRLRDELGWKEEIHNNFGNITKSMMPDAKAEEKKDLAEKMAELLLERKSFKMINPETMTEVTISINSIFHVQDDNGENGKKIDMQALFQMKHNLRAIFGWKNEYGKYKTTEHGNKSRRRCESYADRFIKNGFKYASGNIDELKRIVSGFYNLREDWLAGISKTMSEINAGKKRDLAEMVAEAVLTRMPFEVILNHENMIRVIISMDSIFPRRGTAVAIDVQPLFQARRALKIMFGWKIDYGNYKIRSAKYGQKFRRKRELQADSFLEICCHVSGGNTEDLTNVFSKFYKLRKQFGWNESNLIGARNTMELVEAVEKLDIAERNAEDTLVGEASKTRRVEI